MLGDNVLIHISHQSREPLSFPNYPRTSPTSYQSSTVPQFPQQSPTFIASHTHPSSRHNSIPQSPAQSAADSPVLQPTSSSAPRLNGLSDRPLSRDTNQTELPRPKPTRFSNEPRTTRTADPMSFSSILSNNATDPPKPSSRPSHSSKQVRKSSHTVNGETPTSTAPTRKTQQKSTPSTNDYPGLMRRPVKVEAESTFSVKASGKSRSSIIAAEKESEKVRKEIAKIDALALSDIESPKWATAKENHVLSAHKRYADIENAETGRRKVSKSDSVMSKGLDANKDLLAPSHRNC